ncbi:DEAD/DEAH box helicase [Scleromatobacter humisilvae]|uniref:DEAD/DEAH box helicase n=1 Tax=Scleromatobacter humisilvae TaxID=2897159 RepID=A0A9X2C0X4_9BURK|nr:DEAD/DEAH box helicase [Scleromatobacter humisilvae]MCK9684350.1 DEAD/DEAH box helicase [Scleromatobacter humisilvae]
MSFDTQSPLGNEEQQDAVQPEAQASGFATLGLAPEILRSVTEAGYTEPTDVQSQAIPAAISGVDLLVSSRTGSGKTAAFVLPALQRVIEARRDPAKKRERGQPSGPRVLVLAPTRELAMQVSKACSVYGRNVQGLRVATVVGGVPYIAQLKALRGPLDILIATPGRLIDHMGSGKAMMSQVELLILDEADRMLDMGFIDDIHHIAKELSAERQTMMFSATFDGTVGGLAKELTHDAQRIRISAPTEQHTQIEQRLHWADNRKHRDDLLDQLLTDRNMEQAVVFTSTQRDADELADRLQQIGHSVAALHGGMPQGRRNRVLGALRMKQLKVLVATDVAARGIDVPTITHVINYGLPMKAEDYVHRIGRTGRAGRSGLAITIAERRDIPMIRRIERFTTHNIPASVVPGLEPRLQAPAAQRPGSGRFDEERSFGHRPSFGGNRGGFNGPRNGDRPGYGPRPGFGGDRPNFGGDRGPGHGGDRPQFNRDGGAPRGNFGGDNRGNFGGERPAFNGPRGDSPFQRPEGGPRGDYRGQRPQQPFNGGDRPQFNREGGDRPAFNREGGDRPFARPHGDRPAFNREGGDRPFARPQGDRPAFGGERPAFGAKRSGPGGPGPRGRTPR